MTDSNIAETMQREAAEGDAWRRERESARAKRSADAVPVSSLPSRAWKSPPMHEQVAAALEGRHD